MLLTNLKDTDQSWVSPAHYISSAVLSHQLGMLERNGSLIFVGTIHFISPVTSQVIFTLDVMTKHNS